MALDITHVQAGELITSELVNDLIIELEKLDARVTALEGAGDTGAVEITAVSPTTVRVGDEITIVGKNFQFLTGGARVRFNGIPPQNIRSESNDSLIICEVPPLNVVIPENGMEVTLSVSNRTTTATEEIIVKPEPQEQSGTLNVTFASVSPDPVLADETADFEFTVVSEAALPATVVVSPRVVGPTGTPLGWTTRVLDASKQEIADRQITIHPAETLAIFVQAEVPDGTNGDEFTVEADMAGGGVSGSGDASLTVGQASNLDTSITKFSGVAVTGPGASLVAGVLTVPAGVVATVGMEADFTVAGDYTVTLTPTDEASGWTLELTDPTPDSSGRTATLTINQADIRNGGGTANAALEFAALPASGASSGHVVIAIQRTGQSKRRVSTFDLKRKVGG